LAELDKDDSKKNLDIFSERPKKGDSKVPRVKGKLEIDSF